MDLTAMRPKVIATAIVLIVAVAAVASIPHPKIVAFNYQGATIPAVDRATLERSIRNSIQTPSQERIVVTISDRVVAVR
jgi:hypothetical protein